MKADRKEVTRLNQTKVNKDDFATQMQAIDVIHRMIAHLSVLLMELSRQQLSENSDSI